MKSSRAEPRASVLGFALRGVGHAFHGIGLFNAVISVLALTGSLFVLEIYDCVLPSRSVPTLVVLSLLAVALFACYGLLDFFRGSGLVRLGAWLDAAIGSRVYQAIVRLPLSRLLNSSKAEPRSCRVGAPAYIN